MRYLLIILILLIINACQNPETFNNIDNNQTDTNNSKIEHNLTKNAINVYFSKFSSNYQNGIDDLIAKDINSAKNSIYLALYTFTNKKILNALNSAKQRGINIKIVADDDELTKDYNLYDNLENISVDGDMNSCTYLMHNKLLVVDNNISWLGSANFTYSYYRNYENMLRVTTKEISLKYKEEIEEIQNHQLQNNPLENSRFQLYFSPTDNIENKIVRLIENAQKWVYILSYTFTSEKIKDALIRAQNRGVAIKIILDKNQANSQYSQYQDLKDAQISVKLLGSENRLMHNKVLIIDNMVETGSYNLTKSANKDNCENSLILKENNILEKFLNYFNSLWQQ